MKLLGSPASPYTRKVRVVLAEKRIECEMELVDVQPAENPVNAHNPLGKIPTLLLDDGSALYDSRVIVDFLDARSPISRLIPDETRDRLAVRRWEALADGVLDAGLLVRYETLRPPQERSQAWSDKQLARMHRGLAVMAKDLEGRPILARRYRGGLLSRLARLPQARRGRLAHAIRGPRAALPQTHGALGVRRLGAAGAEGVVLDEPFVCGEREIRHSRHPRRLLAWVVQRSSFLSHRPRAASLR